MANLTISVSETILRRARIRALEQGTSVNQVLSEYLARYAGVDAGAFALDRFLDLARETAASSGPGGRTWTRDDAHERPGIP